MKNYVQDKIIIITGGSSGFGLAAAGLLLELGGQVVITGRNQKRLQAAAGGRLFVSCADGTVQCLEGK